MLWNPFIAPPEPTDEPPLPVLARMIRNAHRDGCGDLFLSRWSDAEQDTIELTLAAKGFRSASLTMIDIWNQP